MTNNKNKIPIIDSIAVLGHHKVVKESVEKAKKIKQESAYGGFNQRVHELEDAIGQACKKNITRAFAIRSEAQSEKKQQYENS